MKAITKPLGWLLCNLLFWIGHVVSRTLVVILPGIFYPVYSWLMFKSMEINDYYGLREWGDGEG